MQAESIKVNARRHADLPEPHAHLGNREGLEDAPHSGTLGQRIAPFYVWQTVEGMNEFLLHGPFDNILHSFGWPPVLTWFVIHVHIRKLTSLLVACIDTALISPYTDFAGIINDEKKAATECAKLAPKLAPRLIEI